MITNLVLIYSLINLCGIFYLLHKIDDIQEYSFENDGVKVKYILTSVLLLPACLVLSIVVIISMIIYNIVVSDVYEKLTKMLNKRIL
ncbi:hypothetical protein ANABIO32_02160 [Rossellomorea marisflavi]|nr:hypothetical protein ANABIO32_02160 [Rossellomorea marisflavi]